MYDVVIAVSVFWAERRAALRRMEEFPFREPLWRARMCIFILWKIGELYAGWD